jgi:hypothetical protein
VKASTAVLLAVYTATSGIGTSVALAVTLITRPEPRAHLRQHGLGHGHHRWPSA